MAELIMLRGLPGAGKSFWSREYQKKNPNTKRVNKDSLRDLLDNGHWNKPNESFVLKVRNFIVTEALRKGHNIIVDDTNFSPNHEKKLRELAKIQGANFTIKDFTDISVERCIAQDLKRTNSVGEKVIREMYNKYLRPKAEAPKRDPKLPTIVLCDIDGTIATMKDRSPYDWQRVDEDDVNEPVASLVRLLNSCESKYEVILFSGRDEVCRGKTESWLAINGIPYKELHMRAKDDMRKDSIVKKELYEKYVAGKYNVMFVLDDRDQVVSMWRHELGLPVFQVNEGNF